MSRRIYYWNPKRKQIRQEALLNLREARRAIDPTLLETARQAIADVLVRERQEIEKEQENSNYVAVDRSKNINVVMQYLEMNRDNQALLGKVKGMMSDL